MLIMLIMLTRKQETADAHQHGRPLLPQAAAHQLGQATTAREQHMVAPQTALVQLTAELHPASAPAHQRGLQAQAVEHQHQLTAAAAAAEFRVMLGMQAGRLQRTAEELLRQREAEMLGVVAVEPQPRHRRAILVLGMRQRRVDLVLQLQGQLVRLPRVRMVLLLQRRVDRRPVRGVTMRQLQAARWVHRHLVLGLRPHRVLEHGTAVMDHSTANKLEKASRSERWSLWSRMFVR